MDELVYWLWLASLRGVRPRTKLLLAERFGGAREAFFAGAAALREAGLLREEIEALADKDTEAAKRIAGKCADSGVEVLTLRDARYPRRLAGTYDPPLALYVRGDLPDIDSECCVAVVGTRSATEYGLRMAHRLGWEISGCGGLVVSGLTRGIDAAAAHGALSAGGRCVGVLATAIDGLHGYPEAERVLERGALVSEYPPGTRTLGSFFRARNRITYGLALAALVVEAPEKSGAVGFAHEALEQGREVFAVPGNADSPASAGSNRLIIEGAQAAVCAWDVLGGYERVFPRLRPDGGAPPEGSERYAAEAAGKPAPRPRSGRGNAARRGSGGKKDIDKPKREEYIDLEKQLEQLSAEQLKIISAITQQHTLVDDIIERTGLPAIKVLGELTALRIKGYVSQEPGKRFSLNISQK